MRQIWSVHETRLLWRKLWVALAEIQVDYGLVSKDQVAELKEFQDQVNLKKSWEIEGEIKHDLMAELRVFAEQCANSGGVLHLGATSMDIKDNAQALQVKASLELVESKLATLLKNLAKQIDRWSEIPVMGYTHLQPAEPTTLGYRLAQSAQDFLFYYQLIQDQRRDLKSKGFTGAVGTSASFSALIGADQLEEFHKKLSKEVGLAFFTASTQTYPRIQDYHVLSMIAGVGAVIAKIAFDIRILQSPGFGELAEPFGTTQVGSSAMPFKQNPIQSEKLNSLARYLAQLPRIAWDNAAGSMLERTMDDSANRRIILPEGFLVVDELLDVIDKIISGVQVFENKISHNLEEYEPFAATEALLMKLSKAGANRQEMHEIIRKHSLDAWSEVRKGKPNPLKETLSADPGLQDYLSAEEIRKALSEKDYLGDAIQRAKSISAAINNALSSNY
jgi:adenylosuccinate lyase